MGGVGGKPDLLDQEGTNMGGSQHAPRRRANQHDALSRSSTSICSHTRIYVYIYMGGARLDASVCAISIHYQSADDDFPRSRVSHLQ